MSKNEFEFDHSIEQPEARKCILFASFASGLFVLALLFWSILAPLESAAVAFGEVVVAGFRKNIEHLEGGIIESIHVQNGDMVLKGDSLITLDTTQNRIKLNIVQKRVLQMLVSESRLLSELENHQHIELKKDVRDYQMHQEYQEIIEHEFALFERKQKAYWSRRNILLQQESQLNKEIESYASQVNSAQKQILLITDELKSIKPLVEKQLIEKSQYIYQKREKAKLEGQLGQFKGHIARTNQKIIEQKQKLITFDEEHHREIIEELREIQGLLAEAREQEHAYKDLIDKTVITSPIDGKVMGLKEHTIGGIIGPNQTILEIVPDSKDVIIQVKVNPVDIDMVKIGLETNLRILAFKQRNMPIILGQVTNISPDIHHDPQSGVSYYLIDIEIDKHSIVGYLEQFELYPGVPVQANIINDNRSLLAYLLDPVKETFSRAFKEH